MNAILPHLAIVSLAMTAVASQATAAVVPPRPAVAVGQGEQLMRRATAAMCAHQGVKATIRQQADLFGYRLVGKGSYLQQGRGADTRIRLELTFHTDDQISSLLQVADGRYLWSERCHGDQRQVERIDIGRVRKQLGKLTGSGAAVSRELLAMGGLPELLVSLLEHFEFAQPQASRLGDMPVYRLAGRWRPDPPSRLAIFAGTLQESGSAAKKKPSPRVPREVHVLLGRDDLFPYVIQYEGGPSDETGQGRGGGSSPAALRIELFEVQLNGPIDPRQFVYRPGEIDSVDATRQNLKKLGVSVFR
jgi:hypothetical protein